MSCISQQFKADFVNELRSIVGKRCPKNKVGTPLVSDFDLITSDEWEQKEAYAIASRKSHAPNENGHRNHQP